MSDWCSPYSPLGILRQACRRHHPKGDWVLGIGYWAIFLISNLKFPFSINTRCQVNINLEDIQLMTERLESLKAGIIGGFSLCFAFVITSLVNTLVLAKYFKILASLQVDINWHWWVSGAIACFSGLLFGVTYRYIIRSDKNPQLKAGGVLAFGLVRGLTQIELGWDSTSTVLPCLVLALESVLWFVVAGSAIDTAIQLGWIKPFPSV